MAHRTDWTELKIQVNQPTHAAMCRRATALGWALRSCATEALKHLAQANGVELDGEAHIDVTRGPVWAASKAPSVWVTYPQSWRQGVLALMAKLGCFRQGEVWRRAFDAWIVSPLPAEAQAKIDSIDAKAPESPAKAS